MSNQAHAKVQAQQKTSSGSSSRSGLLQRTCACGEHTIAGGECESCRSEHSLLLRSPKAFEPPATPDAVPGNSPVQEQRASFTSAIDRASRFEHDFSQLPIYTPLTGVMQTKLTINRPGDHYEQEADRLSLQVMRMPEPQLQRACDCGGGCPTCQTEQPNQEHERLQTKRVQGGDMGQSAAPPIVHEVLRSPGQPLDATTRAFMEPRFGHDFSPVRVHTDARAAESAREVHALAYTVGRHIVFAEGQHSPGSATGQHLFAHELTHVVQQGGVDRMSVGRCNETRDLSSVPHISPVAPVSVVQRKPEEGTETTEEAGSETTEEAGSERRWQQIVGERSTNVGKLARVKAPLGVRLRIRPVAGASNEVILPFDELVRAERRTDHGWLWVVAMGKHTGKTGFCEEQFVSIDPPEPTAHLYQVHPGDTLGAIATHYYGKSMDDENNTRLYVQALYIANKGHAGVYLDEVNLSLTETLLRTGKEEEALKIYKGAKVRKGLAIWVPSEEFIQQLKAQGFISSGSTEVMKVWRKAKKFVSAVIEGVKYVAGFIVGLLKGAWNAIVDLFKGAADMIEMVARVFYDLITGNPGHIKDMLMGWVEKLKLAWKNRAQIASDFMEKWEAEDGWDRGLFQGEVLGWVMMTVLITIVTLGEDAAGFLAQLSHRWKFVIDALKLAQKAGDLGTYVSAATRSLGKAGAVITDALRASGLGKVVTVAETAARPVVWTVGFVKKALKLPSKLADELTEAVAKRLQILGEGALKRIGKMKDWVKSWLFGCNSPCEWNPDKVLEELKHTDAEIEKRAAAAARGQDISKEPAVLEPPVERDIPTKDVTAPEPPSTAPDTPTGKTPETPSMAEPQQPVAKKRTRPKRRPPVKKGQTPLRVETVEEFEKRGGIVKKVKKGPTPKKLESHVTAVSDPSLPEDLKDLPEISVTKRVNFEEIHHTATRFRQENRAILKRVGLSIDDDLNLIKNFPEHGQLRGWYKWEDGSYDFVMRGHHPKYNEWVTKSLRQAAPRGLGAKESLDRITEVLEKLNAIIRKHPDVLTHGPGILPESLRHLPFD